MFSSNVTNTITTSPDMPEVIALQLATRHVKDAVGEGVLIDLMRIRAGEYMVIAYAEDV